MTVMERIGNGLDVKVLGTAPCPTDGCKRKGQRLLLFGQTEIVVSCEPCQRAAEVRLDEEERQERIELMLRLAGATPVYMDWSLTTYPDDETGSKLKAIALAWLHGYRSGKRENLLLYGPQGTGKTGLAWSMIRALIEGQQLPCRIAPWPEALEVMKDSFRRAFPTNEMMSLKRVPVLVLDDVGAERPTEWARQQLLLLVDYRMLHKLPTIFTSNFDPDALAERLGHDDPIVGDRIVSRMSGGAVQAQVDTADRRVA